MSEQPISATASSGQLRTLAVRITEDLRAQLDIVAQLTGRTATEEIRLALEHWIEKVKSDPTMLQKAAKVRAEIERKAETERAAIAAIFGADGSAEEAEPEGTQRQATRPTRTGLGGEHVLVDQPGPHGSPGESCVADAIGPPSLAWSRVISATVSSVTRRHGVLGLARAPAGSRSHPRAVSGAATRPPPAARPRRSASSRSPVSAGPPTSRRLPWPPRPGHLAPGAGFGSVMSGCDRSVLSRMRWCASAARDGVGWGYAVGAGVARLW